MAIQGQTVIAASGDTGSEDCLPTNDSSALAIDDPGSQPDVVSAGGTSLTSGSATSQLVWNDCEGESTACAHNSSLGAAGGGYSIDVARQPGAARGDGAGHDPLRARHLPGGAGLLVPG